MWLFWTPARLQCRMRTWTSIYPRRVFIGFSQGISRVLNSYVVSINAIVLSSMKVDHPAIAQIKTDYVETYWTKFYAAIINIRKRWIWYWTRSYIVVTPLYITWCYSITNLICFLFWYQQLVLPGDQPTKGDKLVASPSVGPQVLHLHSVIWILKLRACQ